MMMLTYYSSMFLVSALRESTPDQLYVEWAISRNAQPPFESQNSPESPIYCGPAGYSTISRILLPLDKTLGLLENCRLLTIIFEAQHLNAVEIGPDSLSQADQFDLEQDREGIARFFYCQIVAATPADQYRKPFATDALKHTYEAVRLASYVYAHALVHGIPLSKAAQELSPTLPESLHILIRNALIRTDLTDCWGPTIGVLLWVSLVACACANPETEYNERRRQIDPEEVESRKWLAAVIVRCCIVLNSCEYGDDVLEILRRFTRLTEVLARSHEATAPVQTIASAETSPRSVYTIAQSVPQYSMSPEVSVAHSWSTPEHTSAILGISSRCSSQELLEPDSAQKGFHDFMTELSDNV